MMMNMGAVTIGINFLPFLVAVVGLFAIGTFWYGEKGFGKIWVQGLGYKSPADMRKDFMKRHPSMGVGMGKIMAVQLLAAIAKIWLFSLFWSLPQACALIIWFVLALLLGTFAAHGWENKPRSFSAVVLSGEAVSILWLLAILHFWQAPVTFVAN